MKGELSLDFFRYSFATDSENELNDAFEWLNESDGRSLVIPGGIYSFGTDKRILRNFTRISGITQSARLLGEANARIILGHADDSSAPGGVIQKAGTKIIGTELCRLSIKPADGHEGHCLVIDYADRTTLNQLDLGPYGDDDSAFTCGILSRWTQWLYLDNVDVDVNGECLTILLENTDYKNEDHFGLRSCRFVIGKDPKAGTRPAGIAVDKKAGHDAFKGISSMSIAQTHIVKVQEVVDISGILIRNASAGDFRVFENLSIGHGTFFENTDYGIDALTAATGTDTSRIGVENSNFLQNDVAFYGKGKTVITASGNTFSQGTSVAVGAKVFFSGPNLANNITDPLPDGVSAHRFAIKEMHGGLSNIALRENGDQIVAPGATYVDLAFNLSDIPRHFVLTHKVGAAWPVTFSPDGATPTGVRVHFDMPVPATPAVRLYSSAEVEHR